MTGNKKATGKGAATKSPPAKRKRKKNNGRNAMPAVVAAVVTVAVGLALLYWFGAREPAPTPPAYKEVNVYFGSSEGTYLEPERRRIRRGDAATEIKEAIGELIKGPKTGLTDTMPRGTRVLGIRLDNGTAVVDLSREVVTNHPGGSSGEIQTVYSIINTITLNFTGVRQVQILVEGSVEKTLAGHLDITLPLGPDTGLIRKKKTLES